MTATEDDRAAIRRYLAHRKLAGDSKTSIYVRKSLLSRLAAALQNPVGTNVPCNNVTTQPAGLLAAAHDDVYAWREQGRGHTFGGGEDDAGLTPSLLPGGRVRSYLASDHLLGKIRVVTLQAPDRAFNCFRLRSFHRRVTLMKVNRSRVPAWASLRP